MYYKITTRDLKSVHIDNRYTVTYVLNEWVKPIIGKLMIFDTFDNAYFWINEMATNFRIFESEAEGVIEPGFKYWITSNLALNKSMEQFWKDGIPHPEIWPDKHLEEVPTGTLFADSVKLVKLIYFK